MAERAIEFRPDVVVGGNMPIDAALRLWQACRRDRLPYASWVQDLYSAAMMQYLGTRYGIVGRAAGRHYARIEASLLRGSDAVIVISEGFLAPLESWGVPRDRIGVIPNWAPLSELSQRGKDNPWARRHRLVDKFVAMYTGTLGLRHDPSLLRDLAQAGRADGVEVVVTAAGARADWLKQQRDGSLDNLTVLPFQPMASYADLLGSADVLLALLGEEASRFSVPSKVLSYLAAGRPIVAAIAEGNDAARAILEAGAGYVAAPSDRAGFIDRVLSLARDPEQAARFGRAGRAYAEQRFAIEPIAGRFLDLLLPLTRTASH